MRLRVRSLALLSGLKIWRCRELWCRLQTRLGSGVAVALVLAGVGAATAPIRPLAWEPPYATGAALKRQKKKKRFKKKKKKQNMLSLFLHDLFYKYENINQRST